MTAAKICGLCRPEDAAAAAEAGAAYAGVVLVPDRTRTQDLSAAGSILAAAGSLRRVGVFANQPVAEVVRAAEALRLDVLQLHGSEDPEQVHALQAAGPWDVWKAIRVKTPGPTREALETYGAIASAILLDGGPGGTGARFDWRHAAAARGALPPGCVLVIAGGLTPRNVARAIRVLSPDIVDVSSGVETAPGIKSDVAIRAFVAAARGDAADRGE